MSSEKEIFDNNKIIEALCQFRFEGAIDTSKFTLFFEELSRAGTYVEKQDMPMLHFNINLNQTTASPIPISGLKISNGNKDKVIQLYSDNISIHQIGNYQQWEIFRDEVLEVLKVFKSFFDCNIIRIDSRVINSFEFGVHEDIQKYFNVFLNAPLTIEQPYNFNLAIEQTYVPARKFGVIRLNGYNQEEKRKIVFDLSYVIISIDDKIEISDSNSLREALDCGHVKLSELFLSSITEETRKLIK